MSQFKGGRLVRTKYPMNAEAAGLGGMLALFKQTEVPFLQFFKEFLISDILDIYIVNYAIQR